MAFTANEGKSLSVISALYLIRMLGLFMVLPVLSLYGTELSGATPLLIGLALGIYGLTQAFLQIPFGWASDKYGRKPMLVFGFVLFIAGSIICSLASDIEWLIFGRAMQGAGAVSAVLLALVADQISEKNRTVSMAIIGVSIGLSFGLSVVLSPLIASAFDGLTSIFYLSALLGCIALLLVFALIPKAEKNLDDVKVPVSVKSVLIPDLLRLNFSIFALHFMQMCIWVAVPSVLLGQLGLAIENHWILYLVTVGGGFIAMVPFLRFWDKRGLTKHSILVSVTVVLIALLLMTKIASYAFFVSGLFLFFWGFNLLEATLPSSVTKTASSESKGTATGVYSSCQFLGVFFGATTGGWVMGVFGVYSVFYLSAVLAIIWLAVMIPAKNLNPQKG